MKSQTSPASSLVTFSVDNGIGLLTLNDPATQNSMSLEMMDALAAIHPVICDTVDLRVLIVTGAGEAFSAGGNMRDMLDRQGVFDSSDPMAAREINLRKVHAIPKAIHQLSIPTIAAVNGNAIGGGCDIALMCDIRIASDRAVFAESFLRVGLLPGDGGAWFLPRVVGQSRAMEMALTCEFIDARRAENIGLVSRVVPHEELLSEAYSLARRIARHPSRITQMTKRLIQFGAHATLQDTLEMTAALQAIVQTSDEHKETARAIAQSVLRKKPESKG